MPRSAEGLRRRAESNRRRRADPVVKAREYARHEELRQVQRQKVAAIKEASPCTDCGNFFPAVCMDFDHINNDKIDSVAQLVGNTASWDRIAAEIAKCELVCSNCHRLRTAARRATVLS